MAVEQDTRSRILAAAKGALLEVGYANLSTRGIAEAAGVPLSQIHYHFGSRQNLMLAVLDMENQQRLARQAAMYQSNLPLWKQWQQACDFFDEDLESGYVRVLMEMTAAGWSNREIAGAVSTQIQGWFDLLAEVAQRSAERFGSLGPFTPEELAAMYQSNLPLWKQWQQACDFFDEDLESGYVRVLMEMTAAGWSNREIAGAVSTQIQGWFDLLAEVAQRSAERFGSLGPFTPEELAALAGLPFLGAEAVILLGLDESKIAAGPALRKIGELLRMLEEPPERGRSDEGPVPRL